MEDVNIFFKIRLNHLDSHWKKLAWKEKIKPSGRTHRVIYLFLQQMLLKDLLCARYFSYYWDYNCSRSNIYQIIFCNWNWMKSHNYMYSFFTILMSFYSIFKGSKYFSFFSLLTIRVCVNHEFYFHAETIYFLLWNNKCYAVQQSNPLEQWSNFLIQFSHPPSTQQILIKLNLRV